MPDKRDVLVEIDVNEEVEIRLTRLGWGIYKRYLAIYYPKDFFVKTETNNGLWVCLPLWEFMRVFGPSMKMGAPHVVLHGKIRVPKKFAKEIETYT